jgi:hypothetical protein
MKRPPARQTTNSYDTLLPMLRDEREQALPLALLILEKVRNGGTVFDHLLSYLTEQEFATALDAAVAKLKAGVSESAESLIAHASLQFPHLLAPHLRDLYTLEVNSGGLAEHMPWQSADVGERAILKELLVSGATLAERERAWLRMLQTRDPECVLFAAKNEPVGRRRAVDVETELLWVGMEVRRGEARCLHSAKSFHIIFPIGYLDDDSRPAWLSRTLHPTWSLDEPGQFAGQFGGQIGRPCGICGVQLQSLIDLEDASNVLPVRPGRIILCTCAFCVCFTDLFFRHDTDGTPTPIALPRRSVKRGVRNRRVWWRPSSWFRMEPLEPSPVSLVPSSVRFVPSPGRWATQDWGRSNDRENLNRIGGEPSWIQAPYYLSCPLCLETMLFVAQLDSELPSAGEECLFWAGGICYLFWCDRCRVSASLIQFT